ncbi:MAG TPA: hypothetical protein VEA59_02635 [Patescibacteria group bacterium]|nr:hypothetical protein [Patescibacteria group bacterium]
MISTTSYDKQIAKAMGFYTTFSRQQIDSASGNGSSLVRIVAVLLAISMVYFSPTFLGLAGAVAIFIVCLLIAHMLYKLSARKRLRDHVAETKERYRKFELSFKSNDCHLILGENRESKVVAWQISLESHWKDEGGPSLELDLQKYPHQIEFAPSKEVDWPTISFPFLKFDSDGNVVPGPIVVRWPRWMRSSKFVTYPTMPYTRDVGTTIYSADYFQYFG